MSDTTSGESALYVVARLEADAEQLLARSWTSCTDAELVQVWRRLEVVRRRLAPVDHGLINEVESRHLPFQHGCKTTGQFARQVLNISPSEAAARVTAARAMGATHTATGQPVGPIFGQVAAAQAAGEIPSKRPRNWPNTWPPFSMPCPHRHRRATAPKTPAPLGSGATTRCWQV